MQSHVLKDQRLTPDESHKYAVGNPGDRTVFMKSTGPSYREFDLGDTVKCVNAFDNIEYIYKVKDYVDGWWKLEWPD